MSKLIKIFFSALLFIGILSCCTLSGKKSDKETTTEALKPAKKVDNTPEAVATAFLEAFYNGNFTEAKSYCSEDTSDLIEMASTFSEPKEDAAEKVTVTIVSTEIKEKTATVQYTASNDTRNKSILAKEVDGQWKIDLAKEQS